MSDNDDSDQEVYSYTSSKTTYKRSRPSSVAPSEPNYRIQNVFVTSDRDEGREMEYLPVARWAVDYNNKNYIRSMCNKNKGHHRNLKGRPKKFKIHYDNNYFTRSKVNEPKGLHRIIPEINRKYVPDKDDLSDASGWEFDHGPEYDQIEQDVCYIPEGRIIRRGCYRWYGVKRNDSDYDLKEEERENLLNEEFEQELKYGQEFLQADVPYLEEPKNRRYTKGGYRFYEVPRNIDDFKPEELAEAARDPEWRRKYHCNGIRYLDLEICGCDRDVIPGFHHHPKEGKEFRRTILNKVYELKKEDTAIDAKKKLGTRLSLIPGEGRGSLYEGVPDSVKYKLQKSPSVRSVLKKKSQKYRSGKKGGEYEEYETEATEQSYVELRPEKEEKLSNMAEVRQSRKTSQSDEKLVKREKRGSGRFDEYSYKLKQEDKDRPRRKHYTYGSDTDVTDNSETWKETTLYKKEQEKSGRRHVIEDKPKGKERRKENIYRERDYPIKDIAVDKRRDKEKHGDREERRRPQRQRSSSPDRDRSNQIRKQLEKTDKYRSDEEGEEYEEYETETTERSYMRIRPEKKERLPRMQDTFYEKEQDESGHRRAVEKSKERRKEKIYRERDYPIKDIADERRRHKDKYDDREEHRLQRKQSSSSDRRHSHRIPKQIEFNEAKSKTRDHRGYIDTQIIQDANNRSKRTSDVDNLEIELTPGNEQALKKMPPHIEERVRNIRKQMEQKMELADRQHKDRRDHNDSDDSIDLMKHKGHPKDKGEMHNSEYEKYTTKNRSEMWVKKNEKYAELHHKNHR